MKTKLLLPCRFKRFGWWLLIPATVLGIAVVFFDFEFPFLEANVPAFLYKGFGGEFKWLTMVSNNLTNELAAILFIVGGLLVVFSREKQEDEYVARLRLESLVWATLITYIIMILCFLLFYDFAFLTVMTLNLFTLLIVFIVRFNYILYRSKRQSHEE